MSRVKALGFGLTEDRYDPKETVLPYSYVPREGM